MKNLDVHKRIVTILSEAPKLESMQTLLRDAVNYVNAQTDGGSHEVGFEWFEDIKDFRFTKSSFRSIEGKDHTMFVLDLDTYPDVETRNDLTRVELRTIQLRSVMQIQEEILSLDPQFFAYLSGKGGYLIRKVTPSVSKRTFVERIGKLLPRCSHSDHAGVESFCEKWRRKSGKRRSFYRWVNVDGYNVMVAVDLSLLEKDGVHVFRLPYSIYPKITGNLFICAPVIFSGGAIDVEASLRNTDPRETLLEEFDIPVEVLADKEVEGIVVEHKSVRSSSNLQMPYKDINIALDVPMSEAEFSPIILNTINNMEYSLSGDEKETPPCMRNAYVDRQPDDHWSRVLFTRYLLHRGYTLSEIATFIRYKVNDEEDNSPENFHQMERNIKIFLAPTPDNKRLVPSCAKLQDEGSTFYSCTPEDAIRCGRSHPLKSYKDSTSYKKQERAIKDEYILAKKVEGKPAKSVSNYGKFKEIVDDVGKLLYDNTPVLVKKTTRAGLTTSLVVACKKQGKRLMVLEPTNRIAKKTFPEAVEIAKDIYGVDIDGAVLSSNPKGCLKLAIKLQQIEEEKLRRTNAGEEWGAEFIALQTLPMLLKPPCVTPKKTCEFFDNDVDVNSDEYPEEIVIDSLVTSTEGNGDGFCARITTLKQLHKFNTIFATYAKLIASLSNDSDEAMIALSEMKNYDVIMLDEISTLIDGQALFIQIAGRKGDKTTNKSDYIRDQLSFVAGYIKNPDAFIETVTSALRELESSAATINYEFIRNGVKTITVQNPLEDDEKDRIIRLYAVLQGVVERTNKDLRLLASFILALSDDEWYMTAVTNTYNYTTFSMVTKPELTLIRRFLAEMIAMGKKVIVTDAALPPMSMKALLHIDEWTEMDLGDPRGTNKMQLIVPDSRKVNVSKLERDDKIKGEMIQYAVDIIKKHTAKDTILVAPNKRVYKLLNPLKEDYPDITITYFRSDMTVGVSAEQRTMVVFCKPLPPEDSCHWLAVHYKQDDDEDVTGLSQILRHHSARQTFYQTIGRVKDPKAATPSVVYTFGLRPQDVNQLIGDFDSPLVVDRKVSKAADRILLGSHWRRTGEFIPVAVLSLNELFYTNEFMSYSRVKRFLTQEDLKYFMANLSIFNLEFLEDQGIIRANI